MTRPAVILSLSLLFCLWATASDAQDFAIEQLEASPRHHEWVEIAAGGRLVHAFVAYPESNEAAPAVVVIHENRGLTDWVRSFADQLAGEGYIAVAPDLLSGFDAERDRTADFASSDAARDGIYQLDPSQVTEDLLAVRSYADELPASNGTTAVAGFCWGGSQAFRLATNSADLAAAFVFYGSPPEDGFERITAPVYGFYGENDERINSTISETEAVMAEQEKTYQPVIYEGAGHAFMRQGDDPSASAEVKAARDAAWSRLLDILDDLD